MRFAPEYVRTVLEENFEDAKREFLDPLMAIHYAHLVMLAGRAIITAADAAAIRNALDSIDIAAVRRAAYDGTCEDLFFHLERELVAACGKDVAGRLHTARSRNDIDTTMYRMRQRDALLRLGECLVDLRRSLAALADRHRASIFPAHTHTQPAQPTTVAHYLLAALEQLERDTGRLRAAFATTNRCPLGSCAITGTGFPIDRALTSALLGFDAPTGNTYGSIATVDYLLENMAVVSTTMVGLGRLLQDLLLWSMAEFAALRLADGFVQGSSIMPQKRNPVALEHARALASKAFGEALAVTASVHNTPFGDSVDTEDDLQPLVFDAFTDACRATALVASAMRGAEFNVERMAARAAEGGITLTELADTLVREHGLPFRAAHAIAGRIAWAVGAGGAADLVEELSAAAVEVTGAPIRYSYDALEEILSPRHFVEIRTTYGGPAPDETARALAETVAGIDRDAEWLGVNRAQVAAADATRRERSRSL